MVLHTQALEDLSAKLSLAHQEAGVKGQLLLAQRSSSNLPHSQLCLETHDPKQEGRKVSSGRHCPELPLKQMYTVNLPGSGALKEELVANMKDTWVQTC